MYCIIIHFNCCSYNVAAVLRKVDRVVGVTIYDIVADILASSQCPCHVVLSDRIWCYTGFNILF